MKIEVTILIWKKYVPFPEKWMKTHSAVYQLQIYASFGQMTYKVLQEGAGQHNLVFTTAPARQRPVVLPWLLSRIVHTVVSERSSMQPDWKRLRFLSGDVSVWWLGIVFRQTHFYFSLLLEEHSRERFLRRSHDINMPIDTIQNKSFKKSLNTSGEHL